MNSVIRRASIVQHSIRCLCSSAIAPSALPEHPAVFQVCGAGTNVGKTVLSAALIRAAALEGRDAVYIKPVQTGYPVSNDSAFVLSHAPKSNSKSKTEARTGAVLATTLLKFAHPVSPDLAVQFEENPGFHSTTDSHLCLAIHDQVARFDNTATPGCFALVEGAGGVLSPTPSGSLQADAYRPLRLPTILVGDSSLGGISSTLCAFEALKLRGYDVPVVVLFDNASPLLENTLSISRHIQSKDTSVFCAPELPLDGEPLHAYYGSGVASEFFQNLLAHLRVWNNARLKRLKTMSANAGDVFWYPFTQHGSLSAPERSLTTNTSGSSRIISIDSAHGMQFTVHDENKGTRLMVDACGSWWTNGVGHGNVNVAKAIGSAAGRYGHVMFPEAVHEPAWQLANKLLDGPGSGWASRVFYSDNGSTAIEVSLKMAFRKRAADIPSCGHLPMKVVTVQGCYHGDTLGAMDCSPRSDFNSKQTPWYHERCLAFDPPTVAIVGGVWTSVPPSGDGGIALDFFDQSSFENREAIFSKSRDGIEYDAPISTVLQREQSRNEFDFGALLLEPVMLGSGGMRLVDPAFQRSLVRVCRKLEIPVVFDEVFTGLWRLGTQSGADLLGVFPDIASYGKLLTGGTVPLSATLAKEDVFNAFLGTSKVDALLHGHSYTAHAIGCAAAIESFSLYHDAERFDSVNNCFPDYWDEGTAREISCIRGVHRTTVIGTVLAVEIQADGERGYSSTAGHRITMALRARGVFSRPLGNVIYVLCSPLATSEECKRICAILHETIEGELSEQAETLPREHTD
jgi:bifunctional dethiobiotin synthetase / adenosylmethionine---8-amino-7-oxononanoate aminotransferase